VNRDWHSSLAVARLVRRDMTPSRQRRLMTVVAAGLGIYCYAIAIVQARAHGLGTFDDGILLSSIAGMRHGQVPIADFYTPYGIGLPIPGVVLSWLGFSGMFAIRVAYAVFAATTAALAFWFVARRHGWLLGLLVGVISLSYTTARYALSWTLLLVFAILVDRAVARAPEHSLRSVAATRPSALLAASVVLSLAGWVRFEYAAFAVVWAGFLAFALHGSERRRLASATLGLAALPSLIVVAAGGARGLWDAASYALRDGPTGFDYNRGQPIQWRDPLDRLEQIVSGQWTEPSLPALSVSSYGVACVTVLTAATMVLLPRGRRRLIDADPTLLTPFMVIVSAIVLFGLSARYGVYGGIGLPVFWVAAALLVRRLALPLALVAAVLLVLPVADGLGPRDTLDTWRERPSAEMSKPVPNLKRIHLSEGQATSYALMPRVWRGLGLRGRGAFPVMLRNDRAWGSDLMPNWVLDEPVAAWPLTYDPGLVNRDDVQARAIDDLCDDRAPLVQWTNTLTPAPDDHKYQGSRRLDAFIATSYRHAATTGEYRILTQGRCVRPKTLSGAELVRLRDGALLRDDLSAAGALAAYRLDRGGPVDITDVAAAALAGFDVPVRALPAGPVGDALRTLRDGLSRPGVAIAAADRSLPALVQLAVQTAWLNHRDSGPPQRPVAAIRGLLLRRPQWPAAVRNARNIVGLDRRLATRVQREIPETNTAARAELHEWQRATAAAAGDLDAQITYGLALAADHRALHDPVRAATALLAIANLPSLEPGCAGRLRGAAERVPGVYARAPAPDGPCPRRNVRAAAANPSIGVPIA